MRTKKTIRLLISSFIVTSCFMISQQSLAQLQGSWEGHNHDTWVINKDFSNHWSALRLQTSTNHGWSMVNNGLGAQDGSLWWGYAEDYNFLNMGVEKMRLYPNGDLTVQGNMKWGNGTPGWGNGMLTMDLGWGGVNHPTIGSSGSTSLIMLHNPHIPFRTDIPAKTGYDGMSGIRMAVDASVTNYWDAGLGGDFFHVFRSSEEEGSELLRITSQGNMGIGTSEPVAKLHVVGSGHFEGAGFFSGNVGIGTASNASYQLAVEGKSYFNGNMGIGIVANDSCQFVVGGKSYFSGNMGIGTTSPSEKLEVNGTVKATSFTSSAASFPDYVFAEDYKITPLSELENYVKTNKRLPNMPSEKEVVEKGLNLPEVVTGSVENIETIYLHLIRMEKEIKALQQENAALKQKLEQRR